MAPCFVAACGGGGRAPSPSGSQAPPVSTAPIRLVPPALVAFVGDRKTLRAYSASGTVVNPGNWLSSSPAVASVDTSGTVSALAVGSAMITASAGSSSATAPITVTSEPGSLQDLLSHFPFAHVNGQARAYSDISPEFSREHGDHLALVYNYFDRLFARSYGNAAVAYYTQDQGLYQRLFAYCPSVVIAGGRSVTGCYDPQSGVQSLMIIPYGVPDFGTQLHEFSHQFLYATWPAAEDYPWFKEGTGMFWESGSFSSSGELVVSTPIPYLRDGIRRFLTSLLPLEQLLNMDRSEFYGHPEPARVYSQVGMLLFYLMHKHPLVMNRAFEGLNRQTVRNNAQLLSLILADSGLTLSELDRAYVAYALTL